MVHNVAHHMMHNVVQHILFHVAPHMVRNMESNIVSHVVRHMVHYLLRSVWSYAAHSTSCGVPHGAQYNVHYRRTMHRIILLTLFVCISNVRQCLFMIMKTLETCTEGFLSRSFFLHPLCRLDSGPASQAGLGRPGGHGQASWLSLLGWAGLAQLCAPSWPDLARPASAMKAMAGSG